MSRSNTRYELLDSLRGAAAILVVVNHVTGAPIGYWAVLVFFVISGYCVTAAAQRGWETNTPISVYLTRRLRRIYPPYIASVGFFILTRIAKLAMTGDNDLTNHSGIGWLQTVTLTQWVSLLDNQTGFPADNRVLVVAAHWSLAYEEQFYLFVGLLLLVSRGVGVELKQLSYGSTLLTMLLLAAVPTLCIGFFVDYWPLFGLGAGVFFISARPEGKRYASAALGILFVVAVGVSLTATERVVGRRFVWDDVAVAAGLSILLLIIKPWDVQLSRTHFARALSKIGTISYSLYLIHQFNLTLVARLTGFAAPVPVLHYALQIGIHLLMAAAFWRIFEQPFLNSTVQPKLAETNVNQSQAG